MFRRTEKESEPSQVPRQVWPEALELLEDIGTALKHLLARPQTDPARDEQIRERLDELERGRALWEAEVEGLMAKATSKYQQARNAEERAKSRAGNGESDEDGLGDEEAIEAYRRLVQDADAEGGEGQGVLPLREGMEVSSASPAMRWKYGVA